MTPTLCCYCYTVVRPRLTRTGKPRRRVLSALGLQYTPADCPACHHTMAVDIRPLKRQI